MAATAGRAMAWSTIGRCCSRVAKNAAPRFAHYRALHTVRRVLHTRLMSSAASAASAACASASSLRLHGEGWEQVLEIQDGSSNRRVPLSWIRDSCRCSSCWNAVTHQREYDTSLMSGPPMVETYGVHGAELNVQWKDGHATVIPMSVVTSQGYCAQSVDSYRASKVRGKTKREMFSSSLALDKVESDYTQILAPEGLLEWIEKIHIHGFALLRNVPTEVDVTDDVIRRLGGPLTTLYGDFWDLQVEPTGGNDSAYSCSAIPPHTDGNYWSTPPGYQLFHCHQPDQGGGGQNTLVDGWAVADRMKTESADAFKFLCQTPIAYHFKDSENEMFTEHLVFEFDEDGDFQSFKFNNLDRATRITTGDGSPEYLRRYYQAVRDLIRFTQMEQLALDVFLDKGDILIFDNTRVLHARAEFVPQSRRYYRGAYISRDDLASTKHLLTSSTSTK